MSGWLAAATPLTGGGDRSADPRCAALEAAHALSVKSRNDALKTEPLAAADETDVASTSSLASLLSGPAVKCQSIPTMTSEALITAEAD